MLGEPSKIPYDFKNNVFKVWRIGKKMEFQISVQITEFVRWSETSNAKRQEDPTASVAWFRRVVGQLLADLTIHFISVIKSYW